MDIKDLAKLNEASNSGIWVTIKNPLTLEELPIRFKVCGVTSDRFYQLRDQIQAEQFQAAFEKAQSEGKSESKDDDTAGMRLVAGMVVDIEGLEIGGKKCGADNALDIFKTDGLRFIYNQLDIDIKKRSNFTQP